MSYLGLGADFYGPPKPGQTYDAYQSQMAVGPLVGGVAAAMLVNPLVGLAVGVGLLLTSKPKVMASNRFPIEERKGGH